MGRRPPKHAPPGQGPYHHTYIFKKVKSEELPPQIIKTVVSIFKLMIKIWYFVYLPLNYLSMSVGMYVCMFVSLWPTASGSSLDPDVTMAALEAFAITGCSLTAANEPV